MRYLPILAVLFAISCASGGSARKAGKARGPVCKVFPGRDVEIGSVDARKVKMVKNYFTQGKDYAELAAGKRAVTFKEHGRKLTLTLPCREGRSYYLVVGKVPGDIYGEKTIWTLEDAKSRRVVASGSP